MLETLQTIQLILLILAGFFAYYKFFREGIHHPRIEFEIEMEELGVYSRHRIIQVSLIAKNKGLVEHRFDGIRLSIRGMLKDAEVSQLKNHEPRLCFPEILVDKMQIVTKKSKYFFVRPNVFQAFPVTLTISPDVTHVLIRATFKYGYTEDVHSAERAFELRQVPSASHSDQRAAAG
ncbi:MAG: hypothetical protein AAF711_18310 [Planctomycetota bacterium]